MKGNKRHYPVLVLPLLAILLVLLSWAGPKRAMANGTLTATFIYHTAVSNTPMAGAYAYLHVYPQGGAIAEKYFRPAQYILGPTGAIGNLVASVPAGQYRVALIKKTQLPSNPDMAQLVGPPGTGDYIWYGTSPVTIADGSTTDLGTADAQIFAEPVTVTGVVNACNWTENTSSGTWYCAPGAAEANYFVFATTSLCPFSATNDFRYYPEYDCAGIAKYPALGPTDANGNYTLSLPAGGAYYIYAGMNPGQAGGKRNSAGAKPCGPISSASEYAPNGDYSNAYDYYDYNNPVTFTAGGTYNLNCTWFQ